MPSFDVVSEVDLHEVNNAVAQANKEVGTRFDFKGSNARFELKEKDSVIMMHAESAFQLQQMTSILHHKLSKRGVDLACLKADNAITQGKEVHQALNLQQGLDAVFAKKLVKLTKESKLKVQAAIQGEKVRITGKKRDDLQQAIALFRESDLELPLQYENFRD
ncbi:MAG: YajQ family cyclic di-GMP-binding protein [Thiotrichaceae bacterium]|nr:YajQ family cyclic di-GMP-binding protein [Thiotrichaceae bacterium]